MAVIVGNALLLSAIDARTAVATPSQDFVSQAYVDILNRPVDPPSLDSFSTALDGGSLTRTQVALALAGSAEYRQIEVQASYRDLLHREAGPADLTTGLSVLGSGDTLEQLQAILLGSPECLAIHGGTNDGWLDGVYADLLGRPLSPNERAADDSLLATTTLAQFAAVLLSSTEYRTDLIDAIYVHYLHRHADPLGLNSFMAELNAGVPDETVIAQVVGSPEYFQNAQTVPEPSASALLAVGGLALLRRRRPDARGSEERPSTTHSPACNTD
ncbi:MAG: DUF4214 domain-containing protein [Tepidisphaerales bacterium]